MRKKLLTLGIGIFCTVMLVSCGNKKSTSTEGTIDGRGLKAVLSMSDASDLFRKNLGDAALEAAAASGMELTLEDAAGSMQKQMNDIKNAKDVDVIICALCDSKTAQAMETNANGIPIVFINSCPEDDYLKANKYVYVGSNEEVAGQLQAEYILDKYASKDTINVAILKGEKRHSATKGRTAAVKYTLAESGKNINYVFDDYADWSTDKAKEVFDIFSNTGQQIDCVLCNNDNMALGAIEGAKQKNIDLSQMLVLGVDATDGGVAAVEAGDMACTIFQSAKGQGEAAVKAAITLAKDGDIASLEGGEENSKYLWVPFESVTVENVSNYK